MRHRVFVLLLAGALLLAVTTLRQAAQATPFSDTFFMGSIPLWDLRAAIPFGIFCAGLFAAGFGMSAQLLRSILLLTGKKQSCTFRLSGRISTAALWCGWPFVACCMGALLYIEPRYFIPEAADIQPHHLDVLRPLLSYQLYGSIILMVLCRLLESIFPGRRWVGGLCLPLVVLVLLSTELFWGGDKYGTLLIAAALMLTPALFCLNKLCRIIAGLLLLASAAAFGVIFQARDAAGIFPTGTADYICYAVVLTVVSGLVFFKISELRRRH